MEHPVLLKSVRVHDPNGPWHNKVVDVLLDQGEIKDVGPSLSHPSAQTLAAEGSVLSQGWIDGQSHFREPGEETQRDPSEENHRNPREETHRDPREETHRDPREETHRYPREETIHPREETH